MENPEILESRIDEFTELCTGYIERLGAFKEEHATLMAEWNSDDFKNRDPAVLWRWRLFVKSCSETMQAFHMATSPYKDVLSLTPWQNDVHFSHNLGTTPLFIFWDNLNRLFRGEDTEALNSFSTAAPHFSSFIDQIIFHLQSIMSTVREALHRDEKEAPPETSVVTAIQAVLKSRIFFGPLRIPGISEHMTDAPHATFLGDTQIHVQLALSELFELCYLPISNAHRIMLGEENREKLKLEVTTRDLDFEGQKLTVIEFFNTGKLVDFNALYEAMLALPDIDIAEVMPDKIPLLHSIKKGSRQARLELNEDALLIGGITLTSGGTGIGLNDLKRHIELRGGSVLLNNIYYPHTERGFCVTLILPSEQPIDPEGLKKQIGKLKELLQSGRYFLSTPNSSQESAIS